jgi:hypothetical protein
MTVHSMWTDIRGGFRGPAASGSSRARCGRPRGRAADSVAAEVALEDAAVGRAVEERAPGLQLAHPIGGFPAWISAIRQLLRYWPPRMVSAKWTFQPSRSSTFASAAATPPSAITVCALPSSDLQMRPTDTPAWPPRWPRAGPHRRHRQSGHRSYGPSGRGHLRRILRSVITPIEQRRTYRSADITLNRLIHANSWCRPLRPETQA